MQRQLYGTNDPYQIYSAGRNDHGQLGVRDKLVRPTPTIIRGIYRPVQLSTASFHSLANTVDSDGGVYGWGGETPGQLSLISDYGVPQDRSSGAIIGRMYSATMVGCTEM